jgi:hypothetical protein
VEPEPDSSADSDEEEEASERRAEAALASEALEVLYQRIEERVGPFQVCDGSAMFCTQSAMNHSCAPNTVATYPHNSAQVEIVATEDIPEGAEITMCYVDGLDDPACPREDRRGQLLEFYLFECGCPRCAGEVELFDGDSCSDDSE